MPILDELGDCDSSYFRKPCVYLRDGLDDRSCVRPNCSHCTYTIGRTPYCEYSMNRSCTYYNCWSCDAAKDDNEIARMHKSLGTLILQ